MNEHRLLADTTQSVAVVVAHPDDETIGLGVQLARWPRLRLVHVTDGAPRDRRDARAAGFATCEAYAAARASELERALLTLGAIPGVRHAYGCADQEAASDLPALARCLSDDLADADVVVTHAFEHGHPDHDATAFAVAAACALLARARRRVPRVVEFPCYHLDRNGRTAYGRFRADEAHREREHVALLTREEQARKRRAVECFATQRDTLAPFPLDVERWRDAPRHDFLRAAPAGGAWYDRRGWRMTSALWRRCAAQACAELEWDLEVA